MNVLINLAGNFSIQIGPGVEEILRLQLIVYK